MHKISDGMKHSNGNNSRLLTQLQFLKSQNEFRKPYTTMIAIYVLWECFNLLSVRAHNVFSSDVYSDILRKIESTRKNFPAMLYYE